jgi:hypothetical protein
MQELLVDPNGLLTINLSVPWPAALCDMLYNVREVANGDFETPPGLGICPLDVLFTTCRLIHAWMSGGPTQAVVCPTSPESKGVQEAHQGKANLHSTAFNTRDPVQNISRRKIRYFAAVLQDCTKN